MEFIENCFNKLKNKETNHHKMITNLKELLQTQAKRFNNKICAIFPNDNEEITYKELIKKAEIISNYLNIKNIKPKSRILILSKRTKEGYLAYMGSIWHSSMVLWIDERLSNHEKKKLIEKYKYDCILIDDKYYSENLIENTNTNKIFLIKNLFNKNQELSTKQNNIIKNDPAICIYTSGSTGEPKGIISTHKNILWGAKSLKDSLELNASERLLAVTPFSGTNGQIFTIWSVIFSGGCGIYYQEMFTPYKLFQLVDKYQATWINATPTYYSIITKSNIKKQEVNTKSLKFVRTSSAPLPKTVQEKFEYEFSLPMVDSLGMSETAGQLFVNGRKLRKKGSVGSAVMTEFEIRDKTGKDIKSEYKPGELWVKCDGIMQGYLDDPEKTQEVIKDDWFYTGDIAEVDQDGFIFLKGRKKDIAIIGGKNVSLKEIDDILYEHPKILNGISIAIPDEISSNRIVACIQLSEQVENHDELYQFFHEKIASFKCPKEICIVNSFPQGGGGKILRSKVKEEYLEGKYGKIN